MEEQREDRRASSLLPHLLLESGVFNSSHQFQDVMGFESRSLTPPASDLTPSGLRRFYRSR